MSQQLPQQTSQPTGRKWQARPLALAMALPTLALIGCGGGLIRSSEPNQDRIAQLERQIVELKRRATVGEVESNRLAQEVERLERELAERDAAIAAAERAVRETQAIGRVANQPIEIEPLLDSEPIEEAELELEPPVVAETLPRQDPPTEVTSSPAESPAARPLEQVDSSQGQYDRAYTSFHQKRYAQAEASFRQFIDQHPDSELADNAQFWIGESRYARGDFTSALAAFTRTVETYPTGNKVPDAMLKAGKCLEALGDQTSAKRTYEEVADRFPGTSAAAQAKDRLSSLR